MKKLDCDVAVIGGGIAGMMAALRCAQEGKSVLVFERQSADRYLCNTRLTGGVFHCAMTDIRTPADELSAIILRATDHAADPALARLVAGNARRAVNWLQQLGIRFVRGSADPWHSFVLAPPGIAQLGRHWEGRCGDVLLRTLEAELGRHQGKVLRGHEAKELIMDGRQCRGVRIAMADGSAVDVASSAVVLADGGFQSNNQLLKEFVSPQPESVVQRNAGTGIGSGLRMAIAAGAAVSDLRSFYGHILSRDALKNDQLWPYPWLDEIAKRYLVVDAAGRRFTDEGRGGVSIANDIAHQAQPDTTAVIFDEDGWNGPARERFLPANPNLEKAGGTILRASSIRELAARAGIDPDGLATEVERYNAAVESGHTDDLQPPRTVEKFSALAVRKAPFYAIPAAAGITYTMGGVLIDEFCRVKAEEGGTLAGLYAAGSTTGGLEGGEHAGYVGGLVKASVTALRCAEHIAGVSGA
jgi:fumarate reductase flavoprotein subunit